MGTTALAFALGWWTADGPVASPAGAGDARSGGAYTGGEAWADRSTGPDSTGNERSHARQEESRPGMSNLARVANGSDAASDWDAASREAGLLPEEDARIWFEALMNLPPGRRRDALAAHLLVRIGGSDPVGALALSEGIGHAGSRESARRRIVENWAATDPAAALAWIESSDNMIPGRLSMERYESWIEGYARTDPSGAKAYVLALPEDGRADLFKKREMMERIIETQMEAGRIPAALASLEGLPDGAVREEALEELYSGWADEDPVAASEHFLANRERFGDRGVAGLVRSWAESDPGAAAGFVEGLGVGDPSFEVAVSSLIERWSRYDLEAPAQWLNELPAAPEVDRAVALYSMRASAEDPEGAMTWAESISSADTRMRVMRRVAGNWGEVDPEGLETYLQSSDFDEETREQLRKSRPRGGFGGRWWRD